MDQEKKSQTRLKRALSVRDLLSKRYQCLPLSGKFEQAFGSPEDRGTWFVWGNSGNGKTSFVMQLCKELARFGAVLYNSLEEGNSLTLSNAMREHNMNSVNKQFKIVSETIAELSDRLKRRRSPDMIVIDSFQFAGMTYESYCQLRIDFPTKLFIIISQTDGTKPLGRTAVRVMYDASLKIWVEGFRAISKGRYFGELGKMTIWAEREQSYWGDVTNEELITNKEK